MVAGQVRAGFWHQRSKPRKSRRLAAAACAIASIEQPAVIERILEHLRHTVEPVDPAHPSRAPPQGDRLV